MKNKRKLLIASSNQGKIKEIKNYLQDLGFIIIGLEQYPNLQEVIEDKETFKANALKKARIRAKETGILTLADDSGLEVDYLQGKPGVFSARYAGIKASDQANNQKLLKELKDVPFNERKACFKCVMALVDPKTNKELTVTGTYTGYIADKAKGENGFGYDPLFYIPAYNKTMAQLSLAEKNRISHRAVALRKLKEQLKNKMKIFTEGDSRRI